jgi:hypothetical protein
MTSDAKPGQSRSSTSIATDSYLAGEVEGTQPAGAEGSAAPIVPASAGRNRVERPWTRRFVYGTWGFMLLSGLFFVLRYPDNGPIIDEWEFVPALTNEEPLIPWLWKLHNEHRFPLPRLIYYVLFQVTHDFRTGCLVSLAGMSALALGFIHVARRLRGRLHFTDAFFPISLLHLGHWENYLMGYQLCFMLVAVLAGIMLVVILNTRRENLFIRGIQAGLVGYLLMLCGAGGLAFGPPAAVWLMALAGLLLFSEERWRIPKAMLLLTLAASLLVYALLYFHGYARPEHHPPSAGVWPSLKIAFEALSMAFGPAAMGLWPVSILIIVALAAYACMLLMRRIVRDRAEQPRALGLALYLAAVAGLALGIGWGRSGFTDGNMGFASRYSWIVWPALGALYSLGIVYDGDRWPDWLSKAEMFIGRRFSALAEHWEVIRVRSRPEWLPLAIFGTAVLMWPFNFVTGLMVGEDRRADQTRWQADVRSGMNAAELAERHYGDYPEYLQERIRVGVTLLREHGISYYRPLTPDSK